MDDRLTGRLCKAARALLGITQVDLANAANVAKQTVVNFERGAHTPYPNNLSAIRRALESEGVSFTVEGGTRLGVSWSDPSAPGNTGPEQRGSP